MWTTDKSVEYGQKCGVRTKVWSKDNRFGHGQRMENRLENTFEQKNGIATNV